MKIKIGSYVLPTPESREEYGETTHPGYVRMFEGVPGRVVFIHNEETPDDQARIFVGLVPHALVVVEDATYGLKRAYEDMVLKLKFVAKDFGLDAPYLDSYRQATS